MGGDLGGEWISVCVWLSPFCCPPETITVFLVDYTAIQSKNFKKKTPGYREVGREEFLQPGARRKRISEEGRLDFVLQEGQDLD